jgi:hypothetical protein
VFFVDYMGPSNLFPLAAEAASREVAASLRVPQDQVVTRRIVTEGGFGGVEIWVELSSEEQLYRLGRSIAEGISNALRVGEHPPDVWVMFRLVPLSHAYLNGAVRGRASASFD